jgi:RNA polymerase sigma-70 factor (ECF subfamily)
MNDPEPFAEAMAHLRAGDEAEAARVFHRFAGRLVRLAHLHLDARIRQKVDAEDVIQSVFRSFFQRQGEGQFAFADWDSVWSMLVVITLRKCGHQVERFRAARRDVQREQAPLGPGDDSNSGWEAIAADPTPAQALILAETVERLLRLFSRPSERQIVELSLQGHEPQEISRQVGRSLRAVHRVRQRMREWLEQRRGEEASPG